MDLDVTNGGAHDEAPHGPANPPFVRALIDAIPGPVWVGRGDGMCTYVNFEWVGVSGRPADAACGLGWLDAIAPEDRQAVRDEFRAAVARGGDAGLTLRLRRPDGSGLTLQATLRPMPAGSGPGAEWLLAAAAAPEPPPIGPPLRRVLDSLFAFVGVLTPDGTLIEANRAPLEAGGLTEADVLGRKLWDCPWCNHDEAVRARFREACERAAAGEASRFDVDVRMAGGLMTIDFMVRPVRDASGAVTLLIPSGVDITDRVRAEAALRESESLALRQLAEIRATYDTAPVGLCVFDTALRWVRINHSLAEMNGYPVEAHIGRTVRELLPALADQAEGIVRTILETGRPVIGLEVEGETPARPGERRTWVESFFPIRDDSDAVVGVNVVCEEVTERKRAQASLRESEARLRRLINANVIGIIVWKAGGEITEANDAFLSLLGFDRADLDAGRVRWDAQSPPEFREADALSLERLRTAGISPPHEKEFVRKDGRRVPVQVSAVTFEEGGGDTGLAFVVDLTERRNAEAAVRESDRRKTEFLAVLSHELRNPLAALRNALSLGRPGSPDHDRDWALEVIDRQSRQLSTLIDDLLDVNRVDQGKVTLRRSPVVLDDVLASAVEAIRPAANESRHSLRFEPSAEPLVVDADPARLEQVVSNLLSNAVKYTPPGGVIELVERRVGGEAVISVRDTGVGLAPDMLPRIFELFAQVGRSLDRSQGGLGIGLSLARSLVELHGGRIEARSDGPGQGSEFTVRLPLSGLATAAAVVNPVARPATIGVIPRGLRRLLVVDDNVDSAQTLARILRRAGHAVRVALDGPGALEAVRAEAPDVVILDIGMPGMDGYRVAEGIRELDPTGAIRIVAVSGFGQEVDLRRSHGAGFEAHLVKPVDLDALLHLLSHPDRSAAG